MSSSISTSLPPAPLPARYSNDENDTITNADLPRDNWVSYVSYAPRFLLYALNVTTFTHFVGQRNWKYANRTLLGTAHPQAEEAF